MGNFVDLPNELKLDIIKYLRPGALKNFTHCSRSCYKLALPLRFKDIIMNLTALKVFRKGGLGAGKRYIIRSVCFGRPGDWRTISNLNRLCSSIRALEWFPNIRGLSVFYSVPSCMERNVFTCLFDRVVRYGDRLERLEIEDCLGWLRICWGLKSTTEVFGNCPRRGHHRWCYRS